MGKIEYREPKLIPVGKIEKWIKRDGTMDPSNNDNSRSGSFDKSQKIDDLMLKLDIQRLKNKIKEELEK